MSVDGVWDTVADTPMGKQKAKMTLKTEGNSLTGISESTMGKFDVEEGNVDGNTLTWQMKVMGMTLKATVTLDGDKMAGNIVSPMGDNAFSGDRVG